MAATIEQARALIEHLKKKLEKNSNFAGIGLCGNKTDGYGVKVNFHEDNKNGTWPTEMDGVPITVAIVGRIKKR